MKKVLALLVVVLVIIGGVAGYLGMQNKVVVKVQSPTYKLTDEVQFSVQNLSLETKEYLPCWNGIDFQKEINGVWENLNIIVPGESCPAEAKNETLMPVLSKNFGFQIVPGTVGEGTVLRSRVENVVTKATAGKYRVYFEYLNPKGEKTTAYSDSFEVVE